MFTNEPRKGKVEYLLLDGSLEEHDQHMILNLTGKPTTPELAIQGVINPVYQKPSYILDCIEDIKKFSKISVGEMKRAAMYLAMIAEREIEEMCISQQDTILYCLIDCPPYAASDLEAALWNQNFHPLYQVDGVLIDTTESKAA